MKLLFLLVSLFLSATLNAAISFYPGVANGKVVTTPNAVIVYPGTGVSIVTNSDGSITISSSGGGGGGTNGVTVGVGTNTVAVTNVDGSVTVSATVSQGFVNTLSLTNAYNTTNLALTLRQAITSTENAFYAGKLVADNVVAYTIYEPWLHTNFWPILAGQAVSNGFLYTDGSSPNPAGGNRAFVITNGQNARILSSLILPQPTNSGSGYTWIGVSTNAPDAAETLNGVGLLGIGIDWGVRAVSNYSVQVWNGSGAAQTYYSNNIQAGTYTLELAIDTNTISLSFIYPNHTNEVVVQIARSSWLNISNIQIWNSDSRGVGGVGIGPIGAIVSSASITPTKGIENQNDFVYQTTYCGDNVRIWVPANYNVNSPCPLIVFSHGNGYRYRFPFDGQGGATGLIERGFFQTFINAGFIIASSDISGDNWGNQAGINSLSNLICFTREKYNVGPVFTMGASMGFLATVNLVKQHKFDIAGIIGLYPVTSLTNMWSITGFSNTIFTAYGMSSGSSADYLAKTAGYDPSTFLVADLYGTPMRLYSSPSDTVVNEAVNAQSFTNSQGALSRERLDIECTGDHGDSSHYLATNVLQFVSAILKNLGNYTSNRIYQTTNTYSAGNFVGVDVFTKLGSINSSITNLLNIVPTITNASGNSVNAIWGAKGSDTIMRLDLVAASNYSFTLTNLPTAGDPPSKFTMELYCAGNAPAIIFNASTKTPNHIDHGPFIVGNTTNFIYFQWDGTNITARSGQIVTSSGMATASSVVIDNTTYQHLDVTNTIAGNINVLLTNLVIGNFGSFHLKSDGSARTINIYAGISLTFMSTNATLNSTSFVTTASKDLLVCWDTRQQTATTTNTLIWGISGQ